MRNNNFTSVLEPEKLEISEKGNMISLASATQPKGFVIAKMRDKIF